MAHHRNNSAYGRLAGRLSRFLRDAILKLPPVARDLAQKQLRSRYVEKLIQNL